MVTDALRANRAAWAPGGDGGAGGGGLGGGEGAGGGEGNGGEGGGLGHAWLSREDEYTTLLVLYHGEGMLPQRLVFPANVRRVIAVSALAQTEGSDPVKLL